MAKLSRGPCCLQTPKKRYLENVHRGEICQKHCGAQLTLPKISNNQLGMTVSGMQKASGAAESDKTSQDPELKERKPCTPCNKPAADVSHPNKVNMASNREYVVNSENMSSAGWMGPRKSNSASLTMRLPSLSD